MATAGGGVDGYTPNKEEYLRRLRRIEGQVRGLQRMVEEDQYCIDILTQVSAATRALQSVALGLMEDHLGHCVTQAAAEGGDTAAAKVREASDASARLVRSGQRLGGRQDDDIGDLPGYRDDLRALRARGHRRAEEP